MSAISFSPVSRTIAGMGQLIDLESARVASLRRRVAEVEEANQDLIAFARGHSGAVAAIHMAALAAADAVGLDHLVHVVTQEWPDMLRLDAVAFALLTRDGAIRADATGVHAVERRLIERSLEGVATVRLRGVARGHPLFGPASDLIRAEALIRLEGPAPLPGGVLLLGQRRAQGFATRQASEPLLFLGRIVSRMMARWLPPLL